MCTDTERAPQTVTRLGVVVQMTTRCLWDVQMRPARMTNPNNCKGSICVQIHVR